MKEYIAREDVLALTETVYSSGWPASEFEVVLVEDIEALPAAEVAPVIHAHWIVTKIPLLKENCYEYHNICSHCNRLLVSGNGKIEFNRCPHCGALMDEEVSK